MYITGTIEGNNLFPNLSFARTYSHILYLSASTLDFREGKGSNQYIHKLHFILHMKKKVDFTNFYNFTNILDNINTLTTVTEDKG